MKDILILGVPRAGKTTLSRLLVDKLDNYEIFSTDSIRNAFGDIFPELEINDRNGENNKTLLPNYISRLVYWHHKILRNNHGYIIEGCDILPDKVIEMFDIENIIVIYLGHGKSAPEKILENIRKYDTPVEYSYERTDERMLNQCKNNYKLDQIISSKCKEYGFMYVDTSANRKEVLDELVKKLISIM